MKSVDRMKIDLRTTAYIVFLSLILIAATWSLNRGSISVAYYLFFLAGCSLFIAWNILNRLSFIKRNINGLLSDAIKAENEEDWQKANNCYDELIQANPRSLKAHLGKARAFKNLAGFRDAIPMIKKILEEYPDSAEAHFILGTCYFEARFGDEAIENFDRALSIDPKLYDCLYYLGDLYKMNKNYDAAAKFYEEFLEKSDNKNKKESIKEKLNQVMGTRKPEDQDTV